MPWRKSGRGPEGCDSISVGCSVGVVLTSADLGPENAGLLASEAWFEEVVWALGPGCCVGVVFAAGEAFVLAGASGATGPSAAGRTGCEAAAAGAANLMLSVGFHVLSLGRLVPGEVWREEAGGDCFGGLGALEPAGTKRPLAAKRADVEKWAIGAFAARCAARESMLCQDYTRVREMILVVGKMRVELCDSPSLVVGKVRLKTVQNNNGSDDRSGRNGKVLKARLSRRLQSTDDFIQHQGQLSQLHTTKSKNALIFFMQPWECLSTLGRDLRPQQNHGRP